MPLDESGSKASVGKNIKKLKKEKYSLAQSLAIALNVAREHGADIPPPKSPKEKKKDGK